MSSRKRDIEITGQLIEEALTEEAINAGAEAFDLLRDPIDGSMGELTSRDAAIEIFTAMLLAAHPTRKRGDE